MVLGDPEGAHWRAVRRSGNTDDRVTSRDRCRRPRLRGPDGVDGPGRAAPGLARGRPVGRRLGGADRREALPDAGGTRLRRPHRHGAVAGRRRRGLGHRPPAGRHGRRGHRRPGPLRRPGHRHHHVQRRGLRRRLRLRLQRLAAGRGLRPRPGPPPRRRRRPPPGRRPLGGRAPADGGQGRRGRHRPAGGRTPQPRRPVAAAVLRGGGRRRHARGRAQRAGDERPPARGRALHQLRPGALPVVPRRPDGRVHGAQHGRGARPAAGAAGGLPRVGGGLGPLLRAPGARAPGEASRAARGDDERPTGTDRAGPVLLLVRGRGAAARHLRRAPRRVAASSTRRTTPTGTPTSPAPSRWPAPWRRTWATASPRPSSAATPPASTASDLRR